MDYIHSTTTEHRRGKHLKFEQRVIIQTRTQDGWNPNRIAKEIGCAPNTVRNELRRGMVLLHKGKVSRYKAKIGQERYENNRKACCRGYDLLKKLAFVSFVEDKSFSQGWSFDACYGYALKEKLFFIWRGCKIYLDKLNRWVTFKRYCIIEENYYCVD